MTEKLLNSFGIQILPEIYTSPVDEIFVGERRRKVFDKKALIKLTESIADLGQTSPGLCFTNESGLPQLIFGERRLRACTTLKIPYRYQLTNTILSPYMLAILEYAENNEREDITWREKADSKAELHRLFQEHHGASTPGKKSGHGIRDTAEMLDCSVGSVSEDIMLSQFAEAIPEVANAKTRKEAKKIIERFRESADRQVKLEAAQERADTQGSSVLVDPSGEATTQNEFEERLLACSDKVREGAMEEILPNLPLQDVVCFDPPWGVNFDSVAQVSAGQVVYNDDWDYVQQNLPKWLELIYNCMSANSHLYLFFGIVHHEFIYSSLEAAGFAVNRMPLFWYKEGQHRTRQPKRWPGRCYEAIAFAHKGSKSLYRQGAPDIIPTNAPTPSMKQCHPSAKHPDIYLELLQRSCNPGDKVLDPMCGSGMFGVAAARLDPTLALDYTQIELEEEYRNLAVFNLATGYGAILNDTSLVDELPEDFKELEPGSDLWQRFWNIHPEHQADMLAWRKEIENA